MCLLKFLNDNSGAIQAILAAILVGVTIWYAYSTKQMTDVVKRQLDLFEKPYVGLDRDIKIIVKEDKTMPNSVADKTDFATVKFTAANIGKVPTTLQWKSSFNEKIVKIDHNVILYPDQNIFLDARFDFDEIETKDLKGELNIQITFCALNDETIKYYFERTMIIDNGGSYRIKGDDKAGKL